MKLPWFKHKDFEIRMNKTYDVDHDHIVYLVEVREPSKIPFKKWQPWKKRPVLSSRSFDEALDSMNGIKNNFLREKDKLNRGKLEQQRKVEWEKIDI